MTRPRVSPRTRQGNRNAVELFPEAKALLAPLSNSIQCNRGLEVHLGYSAPTKTKALMAMMPPSEQKEIALFFLEHNKAPDRAPAGQYSAVAWGNNVARGLIKNFK